MRNAAVKGEAAMAYGAFADIYDAFNEDADYAALTSYVLHQMKAHGIHEGIVADLGCGTGDLTLALARAGYDMIGIDLSEEMLCILREKMYEQGGQGILLLQQDLRVLDLYGTVRAAVSTFDTLNHIGPYEQFERALCRSALFIEPGGILLFDMNTPYKHRAVLANHTYSLEAEDVTCLWKNEWDESARCTHITVDMSYPGEEQHDVESFDEYAYALADIRRACEAAGLEIEHVVDGETFGSLCPKSQRYCVTAVKRADKNSNAVYEKEV
jgi:methylase involved in ubiquinone/menaquinone biosynthesis